MLTRILFDESSIYIWMPRILILIIMIKIVINDDIDNFEACLHKDKR